MKLVPFFEQVDDTNERILESFVKRFNKKTQVISVRMPRGFLVDTDSDDAYFQHEGIIVRFTNMSFEEERLKIHYLLKTAGRYYVKPTKIWVDYNRYVQNTGDIDDVSGMVKFWATNILKEQYGYYGTPKILVQGKFAPKRLR